MQSQQPKEMGDMIFGDAYRLMPCSLSLHRMGGPLEEINGILDEYKRRYIAKRQGTDSV